MLAPVDQNGCVREVVHRHEEDPVSRLSVIEAHARKVIVLDHGPLVTTKCGVRRELTREMAESTTGRLDGPQNQGGLAGIAIRLLR